MLDPDIKHRLLSLRPDQLAAVLAYMLGEDASAQILPEFRVERSAEQQTHFKTNENPRHDRELRSRPDQ
jgi:hypothetical protein